MAWVANIDDPLVPLGFTDDKIRFVWCTDMHLSVAGGNQDTALRLAVADCATWRPNAFIATGDMSNDNAWFVKWSIYSMRQCKRPLLMCIGNHDEPEIEPGVPQTELLEMTNAFDKVAPFVFSHVLSSGDGSWSLLVLALDNNFYNDNRSEVYEIGDRIGNGPSMPNGGYNRQIGAEQLAWVATELTAHLNCDSVLVMMHYPPGAGAIVDERLLGDVLQADGRSVIGLCGHNHPNGETYTLSSTNGEAAFLFYKSPAMLESFAWVRVTLSFTDSEIAVDSMVIHNYTDPGSWSVEIPFTVEA